mgnify:CR=1 FL=1
MDNAESVHIEDVNRHLENALNELREGAYLARKLWEQDEDALNFDLDDLSDVEKDLQAIVNASEGIRDDDEEA